MGSVVCGRGVRSEVDNVLCLSKFGSGMLRGGIGLEGGETRDFCMFLGGTGLVRGLIGGVTPLLPSVTSLSLRVREGLC